VQRTQAAGGVACPPHGLAVDGDELARVAASPLEPGDEDGLEGVGVDGGEDAVEGVVGGDAVGQLQEGAEEVLVEFGPVGDLEEVVAAGEGAAEAEDEDILEPVLEVGALPPRVRHGPQPLDEFARLVRHGESLRSNRYLSVAQ